MARIQYSGLVNSVKGKLAGTVFQGSATNCIAKTRRGNGHVYTPAFQAQKHLIATLAGRWSTLTIAQRTAWASMATNIPSKNAFGDGRILTGYNLFMKVNGTLGAYHGTPVDNPSALVGTTNLNGSVLFGFIGLDIVLTTDENLGPNEVVRVYASAPIRNGRTTAPGGFKIIQQLTPTAGIPVFLGTAYAAVFGQPIPFMAFNAYLVVVNTLSGEVSLPVNFRSSFIP